MEAASEEGQTQHTARHCNTYYRRRTLNKINDLIIFPMNKNRIWIRRVNQRLK